MLPNAIDCSDERNHSRGPESVRAGEGRTRCPLRVIAPLLVVGLVLFASSALAGEPNGKLYVSSYIEPEAAQENKGAAPATVWIYNEDGAKISSGKGRGGWMAGHEITLAPGTYWIGLGTEENRYGLHKYTVESGKVTVVETGWVSVATMPEKIQPKTGCMSWFATLSAYRMVDGERQLITDNTNARTAEFGTIQLHPGEYVVKFHGFSTRVKVKAGHDYRLRTGYAGPSNATEAYLILSKDDDAREKGLSVCSDGPVHVLAGNYFIKELEREPGGTKLEWQIEEIEVEVEGEFGYTSLKSDKPSGKRASSSGQGALITPAQAKALERWGEKKGEFDDLDMFGDPL